MEDYIPITVVATEVGADVGALTRRLADEIVVDERSGLRVVSVSTCRRLVGEKAAREAVARQAQTGPGTPNPTHLRIRALQAQQAALCASGVLDADTPALAVAVGADKMAALDRKGRQFDAYLRGESVYVPIRQQSEE